MNLEILNEITKPEIITAMVLCGIVIGSVPTGYIIAKGAKGIDIRQYGSGNSGATNVFREVNKTAGIITLIIDALKGYLPVFFVLKFFPESSLYAAIAVGAAAIIGHNWSIFLSFKGGKGVATSAGVFLALLPLPTLISLGTFLVIFLISRTVSIGSLAGALAHPIMTWMITKSKLLTLISAVFAILIIILHQKNIQRLVQGKEPKVSFGNRRER